MEQCPYAIVILAAGASRRLGRAKQLLRYRDGTLVEHTITAASSIASADVFLVLGSSSDEIRPLAGDRTAIIYHDRWQDGMGSSIAHAMKELIHHHYRAVIISVCDQPSLSASIFQTLISAYENGEHTIIKSQYAVGSGPPTLFDRKFFSALSTLSGEDGARNIVVGARDQVSSIDFARGHIDIDTEEDLRHLRSQ